MTPTRFALFVMAAGCVSWCRAGEIFEVSYPPSEKPGELAIGVTHTVWIPENVATLRGVIVHQHGCGTGACKGGETAAYDLHWQELARKWDCALLGPSYHQSQDQNCRLWCDPRNGSDAVFIRALSDLAETSGHPELADVPWCLWGHSGGGFWASLIQMSHPERIVAIWFQSGTAHSRWISGEIEKPEITDAAMRIPMMGTPGLKEREDKRHHVAWTGNIAMFQDYRSKGAPIAFTPDPKTAHETGDSRYLAIPFFDACLEQRLPAKPGAAGPLAQMDESQAWLAPPPLEPTEPQPAPVPAAQYEGDPKQAVWLPNGKIARAWSEFIRTGAVSDSTPPPAPFDVETVQSEAGAVITWNAQADFESGIGGFRIVRDGQEIAQIPENPQSRFGRPLFQKMSYHDTPEAPLPEMRFVDRGVKGKHSYTVKTVNSVGLVSE